MGEESNWLLFDEPTNHLDVTAKAELKKAMKDIKEQFSLYVTNRTSMKIGSQKFGMLKNGLKIVSSL